MEAAQLLNQERTIKEFDKMFNYNKNELRFFRIGGSILGGIAILYQGYINHGVTIIFGINYFTIIGSLLIFYGLISIFIKPNNN